MRDKIKLGTLKDQWDAKEFVEVATLELASTWVVMKKSLEKINEMSDRLGDRRVTVAKYNTLKKDT